MAEVAVYIRGACKQYGRGSKANLILKNLNMTVKLGSIYGLLGASGCGKTTLLSCICGHRKLTSGTIYVLGGTPGSRDSGVPGPRIGYMPQEIALPGELTVREVVLYFGWLYNMEQKELEEQYAFLSQLLELPPSDRQVKFLSGGQQRRVSFAVALVHSPEILILDEPTVGIDPILRQSIWDYLVQITSDKKMTVIITTHYIEEARQADIIGLMRNGQLLAEAAPNSLLASYECNSLEEVFLILSAQQEDRLKLKAERNNPDVLEPIGEHKEDIMLDRLDNDILPAKEPVPYQRDKQRNFNIKCIEAISRIRALLFKNFMSIFRNLGGIAFIVLFPMIEVALFYLSIGSDPKGLIVAVVNKELGPYANCSDMQKYGNMTFGVAGVNEDEGECYLHGISCLFLEQLNSSIATKMFFDNKEDAFDAVKRGVAAGAILFPSNFSENLELRQREGIEVSDEVLDGGKISVRLDMSSRPIGQFLEKKLLDLYIDVTQSVLHDCGYNPRVVRVPIDFHDPIYGVKDPQFISFIAPPVIASMVYFLACLLTSTAIIHDKAEGIWDRQLVAGVTGAEILLSHLLCEMAWVVCQVVGALIVSFLIFNMVCRGDMIIVVFLLFFQGICGMCFGLLVSAVSNTNLTAANFIAMGSYFPYLVMNGVMWPAQGMPTYLRWVSDCLPGTIPSEALRSILERGWTLAWPQVYSSFLITIAWIILQCALCLIIIKIRN